MPNASAHQMFAALTVGSAFLGKEMVDKEQTGKPIVSAVLAGMLGTLPDKLEPALHPHHRQFFHSVTFGVTLWCLGKQVYKWQPESELGEISRFILLIAGGAYLGHLALDALTKRSLPLVGRINA